MCGFDRWVRELRSCVPRYMARFLKIIKIKRSVKPTFTLKTTWKQTESWDWPAGCGSLTCAIDTHRYLWFRRLGTFMFFLELYLEGFFPLSVWPLFETHTEVWLSLSVSNNMNCSFIHSQNLSSGLNYSSSSMAQKLQTHVCSSLTCSLWEQRLVQSRWSLCDVTW